MNASKQSLLDYTGEIFVVSPRRSYEIRSDMPIKIIPNKFAFWLTKDFIYCFVSRLNNNNNKKNQLKVRSNVKNFKQTEIIPYMKGLPPP